MVAKVFAWFFFASLMPILASAADPECRPIEPATRAFAEADVTGTAVIFDDKTGIWTAHDCQRAEHAFSPASTFKVFNAMAALDSDAVKDEFEVIRWDGKQRQYPGWNRDHSLASGMKFSVVWFYQEMARRIGRARMQDWLENVDYGNRRIGDAIDMFWLDDSLRISARQQVAFLRRLAAGTLPFSERAQEAARRITIIEDAPDWVLHAKTGWAVHGAADGKTDLGWVVGWLERDGRRWFFAVNIDMPGKDDASKRLPLAKKLLVEIGAMQGH